MFGRRRPRPERAGAEPGARGAPDQPLAEARLRHWRPLRWGRRPGTDGALLDPSVDLVGVTVTQLRFDSGVTVALDADVHLRIETAFEFTTPGGEATTLTAEQDLVRMGPLLVLRGERVAAFAADTSGGLRIGFSDGSALRCWPDDRYEAWELSFADGRLYVCLPGGEVAVWSGAGDSQGGS